MFPNDRLTLELAGPFAPEQTGQDAPTAGAAAFAAPPLNVPWIRKSAAPVSGSATT
jgi:hypothetical protein